LSGLHPQNGNIQVLEQTSDYQYRIKLTGEGIYTFTARTTDSNNNEYSDSLSIIVQDKEDIDAKLKVMWADMKTNLTNGDIDGALKNFCISSAEKYRDIFTILKNKLPDIALNMPDLDLIDISGRFAIYRIKRNEIINGQNEQITYYVTFFRDEFGNWSLVSF
ncbi:MAG TPA: hypothetical protein VIO64_10110, partial [Pseudobacteroides sp.]|uniref:hypothetical protein n=1 Tax=Pseudobacteroides sp. TaxID=1968840 RepID=UPI002F94E5C3